MSRRRAWVAGVLIGIGLVGSAVVWMTTPADPISPSIIDQIGDAAAEAEIAVLVGRPADAVWRLARARPRLESQPGHLPAYEQEWVGREWVLDVQVDREGRIGRRAVFSNPDQPGLMDRFWHWAG